MDASATIQQHVAIRQRGPHGFHHALVEQRSGFVNAGRIDENDLRAVQIYHALNGGAGGLRFFGDDGQFFADKRVQ